MASMNAAPASSAPLCSLASPSTLEGPSPPSIAESDAAQTIQRNYRGYRERRQLGGLGLDASTRWIEAVKEAQYQNSTRPRPRRERSDASAATVESQGGSLFAQSEWKRLKQITRRAYDDDTSDTAGDENMSEAELKEYRRRRAEAKQDRERNAKMMGLEYFLELVDHHHRYGSNLRAYHAVWKNADTLENFFYWLDEGEGRYIDAPTRSRYELDRNKVRYLSKEQRLNYLVTIDKQGRFRWAKNDEPVNTTHEYKDSMKGIVRHDDPTPTYREEAKFPAKAVSDEDGALNSSGSDYSDEEGRHYVNEDLHSAKSGAKVQYVAAAAFLNHLLQSKTKKDTWIFVADTSFRLYIGIKQSGAFQHSSFLHGARISAAGLIKVKDGQLRSLSPLSGHYRPPTANFRAFVSSLKDHNVDMSRISISRSYAILLGLEGYMSTKRRAKGGVEELERQMERIFRPEEAKRKAELAQDKSVSAQKEKEWLEREKDERRAQSWRSLGRTSKDGRSTSRPNQFDSSH